MNSTQRLEDRDETEIRSVLLRYVDLLDGRRFEQLADDFTDTAELENTFESYIPGAAAFTGILATGAHEIATAIANLMTPLDATQHFVGAIWVEPTAGGATSRTQIIAHHHRGTHFYHTGGTYTDSFVRTDGRWLIARRVLHTSWTTGDARVVAGN